MSVWASKIWAFAGFSLCAPPFLFAFAVVGRSAELLIVSFMATIVMLSINALLSIGLLVLWFTGVLTRGKPLILTALLWAGVATDVLILRLMPPLAK